MEESHVPIDAESVLFRQLSAMVDADVFQFNYGSTVPLRKKWIKRWLRCMQLQLTLGLKYIYPTRRQPLSTTMMALLLTFSRLRPLR